MATVTTITTALRALLTPTSNGKSKQKLTIRSETGQLLFTAPYAPQDVQHSELAAGWATADRPGRSPLLEFESYPLSKMSFTLFLGNNNLQLNIENPIMMLKNLAISKSRIIIGGYGGHEAGLWRITDLSVQVMNRTLSNNISRASVSIELQRASDVYVSVGPVSGGIKPPVKSAPPKVTTKPVPAKARYYVMKKGDTLWELAVRYYKDGTKWRRIADANGIRNVRTIPIGKKLRIP